MTENVASGYWIPPEIAHAHEQAPRDWRVDGQGGLTAAPDEFAGPETNHPHRKLKAVRKALRPLQRAFFASERFSALIVFQALDAAGKDGAIREVFQGINPAGLKISAFKQPSREEVSHDFLWRTSMKLPGKGEIGVFNRSYYEEVLVVRVHPGYLGGQYGGFAPEASDLWPARYRAIREHELHLAQANTLVLKFWLNVSPQRQAQRFLERLEDPKKRWKFSSGDVRESRLRSKYDEAVVEMFKQTSRPWAPWFCIPADNRWYARWQIAEILHECLSALPLEHPEGENLSDEEVAVYREELRHTAGKVQPVT